ncbi:hypothetical protein GCM10010512_46720 [Streptomyces thermoviolaceus subsp. thermoviolaceus]|nr:hypothetical protein GCM10010512_46720 [Streptomyces thermoviolaceus subsp. thermoviolaceus]
MMWCVRWCPTFSRVAYNSTSVDLVDGGGVVTISSLHGMFEDVRIPEREFSAEWVSQCPSGPAEECASAGE